MIELVESKFTYFDVADVDNRFKQGFYQFNLITLNFMIEALR